MTTALAIDPGRDNITGTSDDRSLLIYSVPRSYPTFGRNIEQIVQMTGDESRNSYDAYGITFNKNMDNVRLNPEDQSAEPDPILATLQRRKDKLEEVRARLMQHNYTGFVLVLIPERLPIEESARAVQILTEANVNVCGMIVNRVLPDNLVGDFYQARRQQEQTYRDEIQRRFAALPLTWIPQFETDVYGLKNLTRLAELFSR